MICYACVKERGKRKEREREREREREKGRDKQREREREGGGRILEKMREKILKTSYTHTYMYPCMYLYMYTKNPFFCLSLKYKPTCTYTHYTSKYRHTPASVRKPHQ